MNQTFEDQRELQKENSEVELRSRIQFLEVVFLEQVPC